MLNEAHIKLKLIGCIHLCCLANRLISQCDTQFNGCSLTTLNYWKLDLRCLWAHSELHILMSLFYSRVSISRFFSEQVMYIVVMHEVKHTPNLISNSIKCNKVKGSSKAAALDFIVLTRLAYPVAREIAVRFTKPPSRWCFLGTPQTQVGWSLTGGQAIPQGGAGTPVVTRAAPTARKIDNSSSSVCNCSSSSHSHPIAVLT